MSRWRVVVADDEPDLREYFERMVPHLGHEVVGVAASGEELVEIARATRPDVIITDVLMGGRSGLDAVAEIRRDFDVAVIVVSGYADRARASLDATGASNFDAFLLKPIKKSDLAAALHAVGERLRSEGFSSGGPGSGPEDRST